MKKVICCDFCKKESENVERRVMPMIFLDKDKNGRTVLAKDDTIKERNICEKCKMKIYNAYEKCNR